MKGIQLKEKPTQRIGALCAGWTDAWRQKGREGLQALALSFLLSGLGFFSVPLPVAACLVLCAGSPGQAGAALLGACGGYILFWGWDLAMEPLALSLSCFVGFALFRRTPVSRPGLCAGLCGAVGALFLLDSGLGVLPLLQLVGRTGVAALVPALLLREPPAAPQQEAPLHSIPAPALQPQLRVQKALRLMHGILMREDPIVQPIRLAEVYDEAAERVCSCCVRHTLCWEQHAEDTYRDLCAAGELIVGRGEAQREDFPARFTERCCHTAGFLTAVNQAMDQFLSRRREAFRREEGRRVAAGQYLALERLLGALTRPVPDAAQCYAPELAVGSAGRTGSEISGDRGSAFRDRLGNYCVLLCDGMGSGMEARVESDRATRLLTAFLESGMEGDTALELLNGFYVLRKQAVFSTVDLLKLDLHSGAAILYKWGAAPSYLWRDGEIEEIGTAAPPPGLAASRRTPEQYELSLREGETLVMLSDGAYGEETAHRLTEFTQGSVRDLAACLIVQNEPDAEDDRTAVVLRLKQM
ncbi:MAG: SpoIIE family protein phosphatase [Oscillospiraceae bacterium]|nr:SpoIIE family protein phosphatase [Oscillospiraceae bacterium]